MVVEAIFNDHFPCVDHSVVTGAGGVVTLTGSVQSIDNDPMCDLMVAGIQFYVVDGNFDYVLEPDYEDHPQNRVNLYPTFHWNAFGFGDPLECFPTGGLSGTCPAVSTGTGVLTPGDHTIRAQASNGGSAGFVLTLTPTP